MPEHVYPDSELYEPPVLVRFKVEAAMMDLINQLRTQGLSHFEIAMALADAAEEYVFRLGTSLKLNDDNARRHRH